MLFIKWQEVRELYPNQFVKFEIIEYHEEDNIKYVDEAAIIKAIKDPRKAIQEFTRCKIKKQGRLILMKKVIQHHSLYGEVLYKKGYWKKVEPLKCYYNNSLLEISVDMKLLGTIYIEYELGISNLILEYSTPDKIEERKKEYAEFSQKVEERYTQYIVNIDDTIKKVEEIIIDDYGRYRKEWTEEQIKKYNTAAMARKILKASTTEEILGLVKIKHIIVYDDRVILELRCAWYPYSDAGMVLRQNGSMQIGSGEMMQ